MSPFTWFLQIDFDEEDERTRFGELPSLLGFILHLNSSRLTKSMQCTDPGKANLSWYHLHEDCVAFRKINQLLASQPKLLWIL